MNKMIEGLDNRLPIRPSRIADLYLIRVDIMSCYTQFIYCRLHIGYESYYKHHMNLLGHT